MIVDLFDRILIHDKYTDELYQLQGLPVGMRISQHMFKRIMISLCNALQKKLPKCEIFYFVDDVKIVSEKPIDLKEVRKIYNMFGFTLNNEKTFQVYK